MKTTTQTYSKCVNCGQTKSPSKNYSGRVICNVCIPKYKVYPCHHCQKPMIKWNTHAISSSKTGYFCSECSAEYIIGCGCGNKIYQGGAIMGKCPTCIEAHNRDARENGGWIFYTNVKMVGDPEKGPFTKMPFKRAYGVELESNDKKFKIQDYPSISCVRDGSIGGQEVVTPILCGDAGLDLLKTICAKQPSVDSRCGLHVHYDAGDMTWWDVVQVARGYQLIQPLIIQIMPKDRRIKEHCLPITTPYFLFNTKQKFLSSLYSLERSAKIGRHKKYVNKRYEWLNTHAYFYHGTLEVRLLEGTFDYETIKNWIILNQILITYFLSHNINPTDNLLEVFNQAVPIAEYPAIYEWVINRLAEHSFKYWIEWLKKPEKAELCVLPPEEPKTLTALPEIEAHRKIITSFIMPGSKNKAVKLIDHLEKCYGEHFVKPFTFTSTGKPKEENKKLREPAHLTVEESLFSPQLPNPSSPHDNYTERAWEVWHLPVTLTERQYLEIRNRLHDQNDRLELDRALLMPEDRRISVLDRLASTNYTAFRDGLRVAAVEY